MKKNGLFFSGFVVFVSILSLRCATPLFSQPLNNAISIKGTVSYYFNWPSDTRGFGFSYLRKISSKLSIEGGFNYSWGDLNLEIPEYGDIYQTIFYNETIYKDLKIIDCSLRYNLWKNKKDQFFLYLKGGPSFIWCYETILVNVWYGPPFHEASLDGIQRNELGLNIGGGFNYFPCKNIGIDAFSMLRFYTKNEADLSVGIGLIGRFGNSKPNTNAPAIR